jgi:hypothetical protein
MKLNDLFVEIDGWVDQKLISKEKEFSEGNIKIGDFLSMLNKMAELMNMAEDNGVNDFNTEKKELKAMKELINNEFSDSKG